MKTATFKAKGTGTYAAEDSARMERSGRAHVKLDWPCGSSIVVKTSVVEKALALKKGEWLFVYDERGASHFVTKVAGRLYLAEDTSDAESIVAKELLPLRACLAYADVTTLRRALKAVTS